METSIATSNTAASRTTVLIAGAGPSGLMLANQLARLDVPFRLVDGKSGPTRESRALGVQARTLELYQALGIAEAAVAQGHRTLAGNIYVGRRRVQRVPLADLGQGQTPFPFLLILEQSRNEALLYQALQQTGAEVDWHTSLGVFEQQAGGVRATLQHADGREESIAADWLVGCDGARSTVREQLGLAFAGGTYQNAFFVADTRVDWPLPHGELTVCLSQRSFVVFFPMPGEQRYRVIGVMPRDGTDKTDETQADASPPGPLALRFEDIAAAVRAQMDVEVAFSQTAWFSSYRVHHRCVDRFRAGRCFVAGDAAHVHSPVGAQGMNTGLQDVCNLAWKLALVSRHGAHERLLDSYHGERWPIAQNLLRTTDNAFQFIISEQPLQKAVRLKLFPWLASRVLAVPAVRRRVFRTISQIGLHYQASRLSQGVSTLKARAGERLPYVEVAPPLAPQAMAVYVWLSAPGLHLLMLQRDGAGLAELAQQWQAGLAQRWPACLQVHPVAFSAGSAALFDALGVAGSALLLVRPDQYIAYIETGLSLDGLEAYLSGVLGLPAGDERA
ncbi:MAG TPA: FAD-dependent monooxygenase [Ideonella sp.]|nr:FAD-dependent monooxygenase [Ideonella sp.]